MSIVTELDTDSHHIDEPFSLVGGDESCDSVWIVPGERQADAAAANAPGDVAVYHLDNRTLEYNRGRPENLDVVEGKDVVIFPNGNAADDHFVFERLTKFGRYCEDEGASTVVFVWLGSDLVEHLGDREPEKCRERLVRLATKRTGKKPAKAKPKAPSRSEENIKSELGKVTLQSLAEGRKVVDVNDDRLKVLDQLVEALKAGRDSEKVFNFGGRIARTVEDVDTGMTVAEIVDDESVLNLLSRSAKMISMNQRGVNSAWPESKTIKALYGRSRDFRPLRGIAPSPIVRADNTIASTDGYDEASQVLLDLKGLDIEIPDDPSEEDVSAAVDFLLEEWLGDFPFASEADKANVLGLILTYPLRELVRLVPLAVISAKSMGTGKSKLISLIVRLFTGADPELDSLPGSEEETRKQITTLLQKAAAYLIFDESPVISGKSINRLLTAMMWSDRLLGGNERAALPVRAVTVATGNNVEIIGDTSRRYYPIELYYDDENPESRSQSEFRHADIEAWTDEHRPELLTAVFTLIRAWQVAGRPKRMTSFGSFEQWEAVVGGVIENAGVEGFLSNLAEHRASADFEESLWVAHCEWLAEVFPDGFFTSRQVVAAMVHEGKVRPMAELPPGIDERPTEPLYSAKLGKLYHSRQGGWSGGYRITKASTKAGGNQTKWCIEVSPRRQEELQENRAAFAKKVQEDRQRRLQAVVEEYGLYADGDDAERESENDSGQSLTRSVPELEDLLAKLKAEGASSRALGTVDLELRIAGGLADETAEVVRNCIAVTD